MTTPEKAQLVKRGRRIPEPQLGKEHLAPVYKVPFDVDDDYALKQFFWNCAICGKEFVARRDAEHCAKFHCPKCKTGSLVWAGDGEHWKLWKCTCGYTTIHNPEFGNLLELDEHDDQLAQAAADEGYIDYTKHETPEED